jgi:hypothetical protein
MASSSFSLETDGGKVEEVKLTGGNIGHEEAWF